jgi:predicted transcriptional regulator of viral defense system
MTKLNRLLKTKRNLVNLDDLSSIWGQSKRSDTVQSARDYARAGKLHRIYRGVYAIDPDDIDVFVFANKAHTPSYVTGETILAKHGLTFQASNVVHSASTRSKLIKLKDACFLYHMIKEDVFYHPLGVIHDGGISEASLERAITDLLYYSRGEYDLDALDHSKIDWPTLKRIAAIYGKKSLIRRVEKLEETSNA